MSHYAIDALIDLELERTVLGQMLLRGQPGGYATYLEAGLTREHFYRDVHGFVFDAIAAVDVNGSEPDVAMVWQELKRRQQAEAVEHVYFYSLIDGVPRTSSANAVGVTARLWELATLRRVRYAAERLETEIRTNPAALSEGIISAHVGELERVMLGGSAKQELLTPDLQWDALEADCARDAKGKIWLGIPTLDQTLGGIRAGEVCGLMARPGVGKTLLLGHVARGIAEAELPHVLFSLEMPAAQIVGRLARTVYQLGRYDFEDALRNQSLDPAVYARIFQHTVIVATSGLSIADMIAKLRLIQTTIFHDREIRLITIDHLGMIGGDRRLSTYDRLSMQSREIKELAKRTNAAVLLAIQVNREAGGDGSKELALGSARDSGVVEEAVDYLIGFRRLDRSITLAPIERTKYRDCIFARVIKNRHGSDGHEVGIRLNPRTLDLTEDPQLRAADNDLARIAQGRS